MKTDKQGIVHLSEAEIVERGWTKSGVTKFLGDPDWRPSFRAYGQTLQWRLYREDRVLSMEGTDEWKIWRVKSEKRRESARVSALAKVAAHEARVQQDEEEERQRELEYLEEVKTIKVSFIGGKLPDLEQLRVLGEKHWVPAPYSDPSFKETEAEHSDRVTVNYLRHHRTNYDEILYEYNLNDAGYALISKKVHALIADRFPELKESCDQRVAYSLSRSFDHQGYHSGGFYNESETKRMTSSEMQEKRSRTMVSLDEQKRLGLI